MALKVGMGCKAQDVEGRVCQGDLQVLGEYMECGLGIHSCQIQCMQVQHQQAPTELIQQLHYPHLCLVELPGRRIKHLTNLVLTPAGMEGCQKDDLLKLSLARHQQLVVSPKPHAQLLDGTCSCGEGMQSGCVRCASMRVPAPPVGCWPTHP